MKDGKIKDKELVKKALKTPPIIQPIGEIRDKNVLDMFVEAQKNSCGSHTTIMATHWNEYQKYLNRIIMSVKNGSN